MKAAFAILLMSICSAVFGQQANIVKLSKLQQLTREQSDKIQVINFWATWCGPCIKELPLFETLNSENHEVKVTLVSLDLELDPNPEKVYKFISRKKIQSDVWLLDEPDANTWIDKVEKTWSGSLPATLVVNTRTGKRTFVARELKEGELEKMISEVR